MSVEGTDPLGPAGNLHVLHSRHVLNDLLNWAPRTKLCASLECPSGGQSPRTLESERKRCCANKQSEQSVESKEQALLLPYRWSSLERKNAEVYLGSLGACQGDRVEQ